MSTIYPNDENGDVLRTLAEQGVDLSIEREIEFAHLAPDETSAKGFAGEAEKCGYQVKVYEPDEESLEDGETEWDVLVIIRATPSHEQITKHESKLARLAQAFECEPDGWGFLQ